MPDMDFRALVSEAYDQAAGEAAPAVETVNESPVDSGGTNSTESGAIVSGSSEQVDSAADSAPPSARNDGRDASGRFAPKPKESKSLSSNTTKAPKAATGSPSSTGQTPPTAGGDSSQTQPPAPGEATETIRPPQSLTPAEREHFAKAPPEVQRAFVRIDREVRQAMQEHAPAKQFQKEVMQAFEPFRQVAQTMGVQNPIALGLQAAQVATRIATAPPHIVAKEIAGLIRSRPDLEIALLAKELDSAPTQPQGQQSQYADPYTLRQQIKQELMQDIRQERQHSLMSTVQQEIADFDADPANEFAQDPDVRGLMSALMANPKFKGSIKDAYQRAIWANEETRDILQKRQAANAAKASAASTQQALRAASSVKSTPTTAATSATGKAPRNHRDIVAAAWESLSGGQ